MDTAEKERLIAEISWGHIPATVNTSSGNIISLLLRPPTLREKAQSASIYSTENKHAAITGLSHKEEALENLISIGQWDNKRELEIEGLYKDIHTIRRGLLDFLFNTKKLEKTRSLLRRAEKALIERLGEKHILLQNSAEAYAETCQQRYLIRQITETEDGKQFWPTMKEFNDYPDNALIIQLCEIFFQRSRVPIVSIRELARSQQWRAYWDIAKSTNDLFDNSVSLWSFNQRELAYWSTIYDSVYEAYERPSKEIISDDDLLDSWFIHQGEKMDKKTQVNTVPRLNKSGRNEEFILSDEEGAKRVYNMNDPNSRAKIKARQKLLNKHGSIKEQDMPDSQMEMRQKLMDKQSRHVKNIGSRQGNSNV